MQIWPFLVLSLIATAHAQSNVSTSARYGHTPNAGWLDLGSSISGAGLLVKDTCVGGTAYAANFGWIDFGDGSPLNGFNYSNATASDFGVNLQPGGRLTGYAYAANIGWINFEQTHGEPRIDLITGKIRGLAYSSNLGWINFADSDVRIIALIRPDADGDGLSDAWEMAYFGSLAPANVVTDSDGDSFSDFSEYQAGTNPLSPASRFQILSQSIAHGTGLASITFRSDPGRLYRFQHGSSVNVPWSPAASGWFQGDPGDTTTRTMSFPTAPRHFFRVESALPLQP